LGLKMKIHARSQELVEQISNTPLAKGELAFWWHGQHSFVLKIADQILYIDPFLTKLEGRQVPPLLDPSEITNADFIFGSHAHAEHIDRPVWPTLAKASPGANFVVPELLREGLIDDLGIETSRFIGLDDGQTFTHDSLSITAIAAAHEFLDRDQATGQYPYLGFIIEAEGFCFYHAGDTCLYEGLIHKLRSWQFDVMCLPINGRDAQRFREGCIGNMTYQEAVDLAGTLQARIAVPTHYDMFAMNPGDPQAFSEYMQVKYPKVHPMICEYASMVHLHALSE